MIKLIEWIMNKLPVLANDKSPNLSALVGLLFGGFGLAIYFRTFIDVVITIGIAVATIVVFGDVGVLGGVIIASMYGFFRAQNSNERRAAGRLRVGA